MHTRSIATEGASQPERAPRLERAEREQITGSLERVSMADRERDALLAEVRGAAFPVALRGYDREAVDAYVKRVNRLVSELEASRSPDAAVRQALDRVGEETSGILQRAQETANEITARSRASADDRLRAAERESRALTEEAEDRVRELEADFGAIWAQRDRLLDEVRDLGERLLATADDAVERFETRAGAGSGESIGQDTASMAALGPGGTEPGGSPDPGEQPAAAAEPRVVAVGEGDALEGEDDAARASSGASTASPSELDGPRDDDLSVEPPELLHPYDGARELDFAEAAGEGRELDEEPSLDPGPESDRGRG